MPCPSATFTVWASAWLVGAAAPDDVLDALAPWAEAHDVQAADDLAEHYDVGVELWSATSYKALRDEALATERVNRLHPGQEQKVPLVRRLLGDAPGPIVAVTDFMKIVPEQVAAQPKNLGVPPVLACGPRALERVGEQTETFIQLPQLRDS